MMFLLCVFFFKQQTAYEMRISDWSSDVCSSDLNGPPSRRAPISSACVHGAMTAGIGLASASPWSAKESSLAARPFGGSKAIAPTITSKPPMSLFQKRWTKRGPKRSEEHTSELQSLMRISYAVFCLKKKKKEKTRKI